MLGHETGHDKTGIQQRPESQEKLLANQHVKMQLEGMRDDLGK